MSDAPFLSGESGLVSGRRRRTVAAALDLACDSAALAGLIGRRLDGLTREQPPRRVLVLSAYRADSVLPAAVDELRASRQDVTLALGAIDALDPRLAGDTVVDGLDGGKFPNLNRIVDASAYNVDEFDWTLLIDDDVALPGDFLDRFLALAEGFALTLAQPAQTHRSHAAWSVTRRRPFSLARRTAFVEIGPVTAFAAGAAQSLFPFAELRYGWGLDAHWGALARRNGWRLGVVDATPVRHESRAVASTYRHADAIAEATRFLADREFVDRDEAKRTLERRWRRPRAHR